MSYLGWKQFVMYLFVACTIPLLYIYGVAAAVEGWWGLLALGMLVVSPLVMAVLRYCFEPEFGMSGFLNPKVMSWGFVAGDFALLPLAFWFAGRGWSAIWRDSWGSSLWFLMVALVFGVASAAVFGLVDGARYVSANVPSARMSPTKVWHDWVVMPVVVALFTFLLLPQVFGGWTYDTGMALVFLLGFGAVIVYDGVNPPDPAGQHPEWDPRGFQVLVRHRITSLL